LAAFSLDRAAVNASIAAWKWTSVSQIEGRNSIADSREGFVTSLIDGFGILVLVMAAKAAAVDVGEEINAEVND
jgi:hypothetical protein